VIHTLFPENERAQTLLAGWGLKLDSGTVELKGRVLEPETIIFGGNAFHKGTEQADWGGAVTRNKVLAAVSCKVLHAHVYRISFCD
jgi:hypothetical protein